MEEHANHAYRLRRRMQETRNRLYRDVGGLVRDARGAVDWRRNVERYPWVAVGAAAALGFFLVPTRRKSLRLNAETLAELARRQNLVVNLERKEDKPATLVNSLAATVLSLVVREAAGWLRGQMMGFVNAEVSRRQTPRYSETESE
jgi:hypothetical protein